MMPEMSPEGHAFRTEMARPPVPHWHPKEISVDIQGACECGCGRPEGVLLDSFWLLASRAEVEKCIALLRTAADQIWGSHP